MRKLLWLGAILMVAGAMGAYFTARYAVRHPSSVVNHCVSLARIGMGMNPKVPQREQAEEQEQQEVKGHCPSCPGTPMTRSTRKDSQPVGAAPVDPVEVIKIEQIDPNVAGLISAAIGLDHQLKTFQDKPTAQKTGPTEVVVTVMEENGQVREVHSRVERLPRVERCADEDHETCQPKIGEVCHPLHLVCPDEVSLWDCLNLIVGAGCPHSEVTITPYMPYADEAATVDETEEAEVTEEESTEESEEKIAEDEDMEMSEEDPQPEEHRPNYHHEHEGCPYTNGHHCPYPYYNHRPYYHQPRQEERNDTQRQTMPANPGPTSRTSNWWDGASKQPEEKPVRGDREDLLALSRPAQWS